MANSLPLWKVNKFQFPAVAFILQRANMIVENHANSEKNTSNCRSQDQEIICMIFIFFGARSDDTAAKISRRRIEDVAKTLQSFPEAAMKWQRFGGVVLRYRVAYTA